jgi:hypothetical protein
MHSKKINFKKAKEISKTKDFFFFLVLGFKLRASHLQVRCSTTWVTPPALFCDGYFQDRVSWTICLGWLWATILLISASWVARIIGVSHHAQPQKQSFKFPCKPSHSSVDAVSVLCFKSVFKLFDVLSACLSLILWKYVVSKAKQKWMRLI